MQTLQSIVNYIINDLGSIVFMPMIMFIIGKIVRMKTKDAISAGLMLGVAFSCVNAASGLLSGVMSPTLKEFVNQTGINLNTLDVSVSIRAAMTWQWPYVFLIFPMQWGINFLMLLLNKTKTINVDMWNIHNKGFIALLVWHITGNVFVALGWVAVIIVIELIIGDTIQARVQELCGVPLVTVPHSELTLCAPMYAIDRYILRKIPGLDRKFDLTVLRQKIGFWSESHIIGFIVGTGLGLAARYPFAKALGIGVTLGSALVLLPMTARLFITALEPISEAAGEFMKKRFSNREVYIGLDWPILAGRNEKWVCDAILAPILILFAFITPGNRTIPMASIYVSAAMMTAAMIVTNANMIRMLILGVIFIPPSLLFATYVAPYITELATKMNAYEVLEGQYITGLGQESRILRWGIIMISEGKLLGWGILAFWLATFVIFIIGMRKETEKV